MKKAMKALALLLGVLTLGSATACGGGGSGDSGDGGGTGGSGGSAKVTQVLFMDYGGGMGSAWLHQAAERFETLKKTESYESGKTGVDISITSSKGIPYDTMSSTGYHIFTSENTADIYMMASKGELLCLDEIVDGMTSEINADYQERLKGPDGKYYALPHYEWYPGISYDIDYFNQKNLYFADPAETIVEEKTSKYGTAKFIADPLATKSCGPNGVSGDYDDGLPSSVQEFFMLCEAMKETGRVPFIWSGDCVSYAFYFTHALWANLAGYEQMRTIYTHDSNGKEIVEVVTGYTDEDLFYAGSGIKKPTTQKIAITPDNAYKAYEMVSRYYSLAALQVIYDNQYNIHSDTKYNSFKTGVSHFNAQSHFITNQTGGMLWDSSYWYNETANDTNNLEYYQDRNPGAPERQLSYMPMPAQIDGSVQVGGGHKNVLLDLGASQMFVNKRVEANPGLTRAIKEFIAFLYSDAELAAYTEETGAMRAIDYTFDNTKAYSFYNRMNVIRQASDVVYEASASPIYKKNHGYFRMIWSGAINRPVINGTEVANGYYYAMKEYGTSGGADFYLRANARNLFDATKKTEISWSKLAK